MLGKNAKLVGKILGELAVTLPLSLITKLADGRLSREEIQGLIREITVAVAKVVIDEYRTNRPEPYDAEDDLDCFLEIED